MNQQHWLDVAQANGLKVVVILDPNYIYADPSDLAGLVISALACQNRMEAK